MTNYLLFILMGMEKVDFIAFMSHLLASVICLLLSKFYYHKDWKYTHRNPSHKNKVS